MTSQSDRSDDESDDDSETAVTFGDPSTGVNRLPPPEDEMDEEDIAQFSLRGERDWMHPPEDDEGSGYSPLPDDMSEDEIEAELERIKSRHQQRKETTNAEDDE
jgi:hypothetical protein